MREKVQGIRSLNCRYKNRQGEYKNSIGNGEAKELTSTTHGLDKGGGGDCWTEGGYLAERGKGGKIGTTVVA